MTNEVLNAVSTVGFPIVMCGGFGYFLYIIITTLLTQIDKFGEINKKYNQFDIQDDVCVGYCENGTRFIFDIQDYACRFIDYEFILCLRQPTLCRPV